MKIHNVRGYIQSLYLVEYDDRLLLLDSGCCCDIEVIEKFIVDNLKRPISDLTIYHKETNTAYIADNIVSSRTSYNPPYPIIHPNKYKRSLKKYIDLGIENFLLAHYNENKISKDNIEEIIKKAPDIYRSHSNTLFKIFKRLFG